jgi:hypothetical protein
MKRKKTIFIIVVIIILVVVAFVFGGSNNENNTQEIDGRVINQPPAIVDSSGGYKNKEFGFSLTFPQGVEAEEFNDGPRKTIVFQSDTGEGLQFYIAPHAEKTITQSRILEDIPSAVIEEAQEVLVGRAKDIRALLFWSEDAEVGRTRELWFVQNGYLYQVTTFAELDSWLAGIMSTLSFK